MGEDEKPDWIEGFLRQRDAWNAEATADPRDAEIARLREDLDVVKEGVNAAAECGLQWAEKYRAVMAQLAAAQADAVALRGALSGALGQLDEFWATGRVPQSCGACGSPNATCDGDCMSAAYMSRHVRELRAALATPAPGAPLLDAVRGLVEAADEMGLDSGCYSHSEDCEDDPDGNGADDGCDCGLKHMIEALAAVRAVLSRAQDTAGISRGGDSE